MKWLKIFFNVSVCMCVCVCGGGGVDVCVCGGGGRWGACIFPPLILEVLATTINLARSLPPPPPPPPSPVYFYVFYTIVVDSGVAIFFSSSLPSPFFSSSCVFEDQKAGLPLHPLPPYPSEISRVKVHHK